MTAVTVIFLAVNTFDVFIFVPFRYQKSGKESGAVTNATAPPANTR